MDTLSYAETTEDAMFGIPADRNPRFVSYTVALDNHDPARNIAQGRLVEYDEPGETSGQPRYMRAADGGIPAGSILIIDDGLTARPYWGGGGNAGEPAPLYPEGSAPRELLYPFPVNPEGKARPDNGRVIDYTGWMLGPRRAYHLKITREPLPRRAAGAGL